MSGYKEGVYGWAEIGYALTDPGKMPASPIDDLCKKMDDEGWQQILDKANETQMTPEEIAKAQLNMLQESIDRDIIKAINMFADSGCAPANRETGLRPENPQRKDRENASD